MLLRKLAVCAHFWLPLLLVLQLFLILLLIILAVSAEFLSATVYLLYLLSATASEKRNLTGWQSRLGRGPQGNRSTHQRRSSRSKALHRCYPKAAVPPPLQRPILHCSLTEAKGPRVWAPRRWRAFGCLTAALKYPTRLVRLTPCQLCCWNCCRCCCQCSRCSWTSLATAPRSAGADSTVGKIRCPPRLRMCFSRGCGSGRGLQREFLTTATARKR